MKTGNEIRQQIEASKTNPAYLKEKEELARDEAKNEAASGSVSSATSCSVVFCADCKHYKKVGANPRCNRKTYKETYIVTGKPIIRGKTMDCSGERVRVSKLQRWMGCDYCGSEGKYYQPNV